MKRSNRIIHNNLRYLFDELSIAFAHSSLLQNKYLLIWNLLIIHIYNGESSAAKLTPFSAYVFFSLFPNWDTVFHWDTLWVNEKP